MKAADQILRKFPEHGETLAMRGLVLNCMKRKEEAYEYVRRGLKHDLRSHVCWHVYGLLYRSDQDYAEAIKCYRNALRIDPENLQIMRDLYLLQIQTRDIKGFCETRRALLTMKPNNRNNWVGFAIGHHLNGNCQMAIDIIDKYLGTLDKNRPATYEDSELYLYRNQLLEEQGRYEEALKDLTHIDVWVTDKVFLQAKTAEYHVLLKQYAPALYIYEQMLDDNADNYAVHRGVQCCLLETPELIKKLSKCDLPCTRVPYDSDDPKWKALLEFYNRRRCQPLAKKQLIWQRIPLSFTTGEEFKHRLDRYLRTQLGRGVPSVGADLKFIYSQSNECIEILESLVVSYHESLSKTEMFPPRTNVFADEQEPTEATKESPMALLWTMYFMVQHYDRLGQTKTALEYMERCISHTPTILDFYQRKGRLLKHAGDKNAAADAVIQGRLIDLADRYINNKATEYLLQANRIEEADATIALFTRHEGDPQQNLFDMQCMWYEIESGFSYLRSKCYGKALKRFFAVEKHLIDIREDQFDFHTYSIRKMTLRAYLQLLRLCDQLFGHKYFQQAAHGAIQCYIELHRNASDQVSCGSNDTMSAADRKKAKRAKAKARKAEFKRKEEEQLRQQQEAELKEASNKDQKRKQQSRREVPKDPDPNGEKLAEKPALEEAWRFVQILQQYSPLTVMTHLNAFDVAFHKEKYLLCLQALNRASALENLSEADEAEIHHRTVQLFHSVAGKQLPAVVQELLEKKRQELIAAKSLVEYVQEYVQSKSTSMVHRISAAKSYLFMDKLAHKSAVIELVKDLTGSQVTHEHCHTGHQLLLENICDPAVAETYRTSCADLFPYSSYFGVGYRIF